MKLSALSIANSVVLVGLLPGLCAAKSAADYFVDHLPGAPEPLLHQYAGHIEVTPTTHGNIFFWLFNNRAIASRQRTVVWLNGGPGCSSMDGALMEVGPYRVNDNGTLRIQDGAWNEFANLLFVDQPVGTGFSFADTNAYVKELPEMAEQMVAFLTKFFEIFPERTLDDLYFAGESYAGQWIPAIAAAILDRNAKFPKNPWNLKGLLIGNGWISGPDQYIADLQFAYEAGLVTSGSEAERVVLEQQDLCIKQLQADGTEHIDTADCEGIMQEILRLTQNDDGCINMYDTRLRDSYPQCGMNWPPDLEWVTPYLRRLDVIKALHVSDDKKTGWMECTPQVSWAFDGSHSKPSKTLLPLLLEKMEIVLFSGDKDLICNHLGTENIINNMQWNGGSGMELSHGVTAPKRDWTYGGEPAGQYQTARNLTYLRFYNASHMVPFDYPRRSRAMLDRFMGVDIASIGGIPEDDRIDGEKGLEVSVGGHPNSTVAQEAEKDKLQAATWAAYRRSGEAALVVVLIAALAWGYFLYRQRRSAGYAGLSSADPESRENLREIPLGSGMGLDSWTKRQEARDVEAARDYDESALDEASASRAPRHDKGAFALADDD